jgi:hypothetical protein
MRFDLQIRWFESIGTARTITKSQRQSFRPKPNLDGSKEILSVADLETLNEMQVYSPVLMLCGKQYSFVYMTNTAFLVINKHKHLSCYLVSATISL